VSQHVETYLGLVISNEILDNAMLEFLGVKDPVIRKQMKRRSTPIKANS